MKKFAYRNIRLCTKDCLCLYVCPTGASDTEDSIIDREKCIGCGACAEACPSGAISIVPTEYPPQQAKDDSVAALANQLIRSKAEQEQIAEKIAGETELEGLSRLASAIARSSRLVAEDISRESGYMLPQSKNAHDKLTEWLEHPATEEFPREAARKLLDKIKYNE